ncbi:hypothetical protein [Clostridium sp. B9]|uniref:hypothetical protein n=1 Tax=Clostridium sp. B9 TaxID=3423224 RepID=UPI003D2EE20D
MVIAILLLILSIVNIFLGKKVKERKLAKVLSGFDPEKDDLNYVSNLLGDTFQRIGSCCMILTAVYFIIMNSMGVGVYLILYSSIIVLFIAILAFKTDKHRRNKLKAAK